MTRVRKRDEKLRGTLRDGEILRVPMQLRDSASAWRDDMVTHFEGEAHARAILDGSRAQFHDGRGLTAGFRPGPIIPREPIANDRRAEIYALHDQEESNRWRDAVPTSAGRTDFIGAREGDLCTVREGGSHEGSPGRLRCIDGRLVCVPDNSRQDSQSVTDERESAYALRAWEDENAWRGMQWLDANRPAVGRAR